MGLRGKMVNLVSEQTSTTPTLGAEHAPQFRSVDGSYNTSALGKLSASIFDDVAAP